jgi:His/Glu/Gln/Arg/opine family amino acid ABC transporter permease subunit
MNQAVNMTVREMFLFISSGIKVTFQLVPLCIGSTLLVGIILGIIRFKKIPGITQLIDIYVVIMRGSPPLIVIMLMFYTLNFKSPFISSFLALTVYHGAYLTEIVRGGLEAVAKGQIMAGESLGLSYMTIMLRIYIPQIVLQIVPSLCGQYILLVKDTTLVSVLGIQEILSRARQLMTILYNPMLIYLLVGIFFYILCFILEIIANDVEKFVARKKKMYQEA